MIHSTAEVQTENIGLTTIVWQYSIILKEAKIGENCNINCHVFIENDVIIGNNVTIKSGVQIWDGLRIDNGVFIGPNVTFTNDRQPRSKQYPIEFQKTHIHDQTSIGGGAVILGGIDIEKYAMIGSGTVVTKDVPERALVVGNPGKIISWLNKDGTKMKKIDEYHLIDNEGMKWKKFGDKIVKI